MRSPGICGAILATLTGPEVGAAQSRALDVGVLIDALNADTEMVLVASSEAAETLAPAVWVRAAYLVQLAPGATEAEGLRALLQEVLNRGRDAVLLTTLPPRHANSGRAGDLDGPVLTAETVRRMVAAYRAAGDEIWAVVSDHVSEAVAQESESTPVISVLLGRRMIELFLRGRQWRSAQEVLTANREHVCALEFSDAVPNSPSAGSLG